MQRGAELAKPPAIEDQQNVAVQPLLLNASGGQAVLLWIAQGFGAGRLPKAPGTFGAMVGVGWTLLLFAFSSWWIYLTATIAGIFFSVWICGWAEKRLNQKDPPSVVMDEIIALPVCLLPLAWHHGCSQGVLCSPAVFQRSDWLAVALAFGLFRLFDILKPFPVWQSQSLPGGWGVTVDDVLAGGYTALVLTGIGYFFR